MRKHWKEIAVLVPALIVLAVVSLLRSAPEGGYSSPSTYDTGPNGYAALYALLQEEGIPARRFESPEGQLPNRSALVVAGDDALDPTLFRAFAGRELRAWVTGGKRLVILGSVSAPDKLDLPEAHSQPESVEARTGCGFGGSTVRVTGQFDSSLSASCGASRAIILTGSRGPVGIAIGRGRGQIVEAVTPTIFDNLHLSQGNNAAFAYDVFAGGAPPAFDERVYGYEQGRTFWQILPWPVHLAIFIVLGSLLISIVGGNLRFAPPRLPEAEDERDSSAYIASLARMLQRGGAAREIVARLAKTAAGFHIPAAGDDDARRAFAELRGLEGRYDLTPADVVRAGRVFAQLRKQYGR